MLPKLLLVVVLFGGSVAEIDENDVQLFAERFGELEKQVAEQRVMIAKQSEKLLDQSVELTDLKDVIRGQESTVSELKQLLHIQQQQQQYLQQRNLEDQITAHSNSRRFVGDNYDTVAFHATLIGSQSNIDINRTLVFNSVKLNVGGSYQASSGVFIAPVAGIYIFSTSVTFNNYNNDESHMIIEKNGVEIAGAYGNARSGPHEQGSVTVAMEVQVGDKVYVSNQRHNNVFVYGDNLSSFMGCLIMQI